MPDPVDLTTVIEDAISDSSEDTPTEAQEASGDVSLETQAETTSPVTEPATDPAEPLQEDSSVPSPGAAQAKPPEDKFAREHGLSPQMSGGRENRIPYSRVKAITENAVKKAVEPVTVELQTARSQVADYEKRFEQVGQFEQIMVNDPEKFLKMLSTLPAYQRIFAQSEPEGAQPPPPDDMPAPDQKLPDGTMVYSMDGLKALLGWQAQSVEKKVTQQVENRYKPIESAWQAQEHLNKVVPVIQAQIAKARTWPMFNDNEPDIVKALQSDPQLSLEGAYQQVVFPKLTADKTVLEAQIREKVLREIKSAPSGATSVTAGGSRPNPGNTNYNGDLEAVIRDSIRAIK